MKTSGYILTAALLAMSAAGCKTTDDELVKVVSDRVELTDPAVVLSSAGSRAESTIITSDLPWRIEGGADWCEVSPASGGAGTSTIYFTPKPNPEYSDRSANYTIVAGGRREVVTVHQKKLDAIIFDRDKFSDIPMDGGVIDVTMNTNVAYTIDLPGGAAEWIEHLPAGNAATRAMEQKSERFRIAPTDEFGERMGHIIFIREDERTRDTVTVFQVQRDKIILTPSTIRPVIEGQTIRVDLRANVDYEITLPAEYADWLSYTSERPDILMVSAAETDAERYGEIIIRDRNNTALTAVLEVWQVEQERVMFEQERIEVQREGGVYPLDVLDNVGGNYELVIPKYATWITEAPVTRAMASSRVSIVVAENPGEQIARKAKLFLRGTLNNQLISVPIEVTQAGREVVSNDIDVLNAMQQALGFRHANWPGGTAVNITYGTAATITGRVTTVTPGTPPAPTITTTTGGTVTALNMSRPTGFGSGTYENTVLPDIMGDLQDLTTLTVNGHFTGDLPKSIGLLPKLTTLTINGQDQGAGTSLNRLPQELGGLESLTTLTISHDFSRSGQDVAGMLDFIGELTNLTRLTISGCDYGARMPESWRNLKKLTSLTLAGTGFTDLGPLSDMVSLQTLSIQNDAITDLPDLSALTALTSVTLSNNPEMTRIPESLLRRGSLTTLNIANNAIERLPDDWSALVNLTTLNLNNSAASPSKISGTLPESMGSMTKLTTLNLSFNNLTGTIPATFGNLTNLGSSQPVIYNNKFTMIAEGVVSKWRNVRSLTLSNNAFVELPSDIGAMTWLTSLVAINNEFTGEIPASIGGLENLTTLNLSRDLSMTFMTPGLTGAIPASITNLKKLGTLNLANNSLNGTIPENIGDMTALVDIRLNDNDLSGSIPLSLTRLQNTASFKYIYLQNNHLSGYIPDSFRNLVRLYQLDLRNNDLEGGVPAGLTMGELAFNSNTSILHLSGNRLKGVIPQGLIEKLKIVYIVPWQIFEQQDGYGLTAE